jgi:hypothetical protein
MKNVVIYMRTSSVSLTPAPDHPLHEIFDEVGNVSEEQWKYLIEPREEERKILFGDPEASGAPTGILGATYREPLARDPIVMHSRFVAEGPPRPRLKARVEARIRARNAARKATAQTKKKAC